MVQKAGQAPVAGRYASLAVVRDGDGYVLGSQRSADFVAVPEIGGQVVLWLQEGTGVQECTRRAGEFAGEPVDVVGFLDGLTQAGLLAADDEAEAGACQTAQAGVAAWKRTLGRIVFGPAGLTVQALLAVAAVVAMMSVPRVRPTSTDAIATTLPLASLIIISVLGIGLGLAHEFSHVLAAWAAGVSSRISIGRRMIVIVYQTDLTRLWSVPRRARIVPLLAGMLFNAATIGILVILELTVLRGASSLVAHLIRLIVFLNVTAIAFQFLIFMRTDVYALFLLATGCKHLWNTKGAITRKAIRRATTEDLTLLESVGSREILWAKIFLGLYVPGVLSTGWYFVVYALPALRKLTATSLLALLSGGPFTATGAAGGIAFLVTAASTGYVLWGLARTLGRACGQRPGRRPSDQHSHR
jgi:hypothetical protein